MLCSRLKWDFHDDAGRDADDDAGRGDDDDADDADNANDDAEMLMMLRWCFNTSWRCFIQGSCVRPMGCGFVIIIIIMILRIGMIY